ncbi:hypothetical protein FSARC_13570 [Fusarium sarcochroum]|uniref:Uncharacterized protein n=1 Tax=Fusarium sarcochroum TaxID=1208366 RepID=A0A8H4T0W3_9HYPO|nr:hypothetical protein FSARC_13570 [Fusarium sarcochroum]
MVDERLQDLSGMAALETLHVDCTSLYRQPNDTPKIGLTICELLPSSIKEFGLMGDTQEHLYEEVLELITTSKQTFPHLRKVIVTSCDREDGYLDSEALSLDDDSSDDDRVNEDRSNWINTFSSACRKHNIEFSTKKPWGWNDLSTKQGRYERGRTW